MKTTAIKKWLKALFIALVVLISGLTIKSIPANANTQESVSTDSIHYMGSWDKEEYLSMLETTPSLHIYDFESDIAAYRGYNCAIEHEMANPISGNGSLKVEVGNENLSYVIAKVGIGGFYPARGYYVMSVKVKTNNVSSFAIEPRGDNGMFGEFIFDFTTNTVSGTGIDNCMWKFIEDGEYYELSFCFNASECGYYDLWKAQASGDDAYLLIDDVQFKASPVYQNYEDGKIGAGCTGENLVDGAIGWNGYAMPTAEHVINGKYSAKIYVGETGMWKKALAYNLPGAQPNTEYSIAFNYKWLSETVGTFGTIKFNGTSLRGIGFDGNGAYEKHLINPGGYKVTNIDETNNIYQVILVMTTDANSSDTQFYFSVGIDGETYQSGRGGHGEYVIDDVVICRGNLLNSYSTPVLKTETVESGTIRSQSTFERPLEIDVYNAYSNATIKSLENIDAINEDNSLKVTVPNDGNFNCVLAKQGVGDLLEANKYHTLQFKIYPKDIKKFLVSPYTPGVGSGERAQFVFDFTTETYEGFGLDNVQWSKNEKYGYYAMSFGFYSLGTGYYDLWAAQAASDNAYILIDDIRYIIGYSDLSTYPDMYSYITKLYVDIQSEYAIGTTPEDILATLEDDLMVGDNNLKLWVLYGSWGAGEMDDDGNLTLTFHLSKTMPRRLEDTNNMLMVTTKILQPLPDSGGTGEDGSSTNKDCSSASEEKKKGCGSMIAGQTLLFTLITLAMSVLFVFAKRNRIDR